MSLIKFISNRSIRYFRILLYDFPIIREIIDKINPKDHLEKLIILWCIYHYVPSKQLKKGEAFILFYENLIIEPKNGTFFI